MNSGVRAAVAGMFATVGLTVVLVGAGPAGARDQGPVPDLSSDGSSAALIRAALDVQAREEARERFLASSSMVAEREASATAFRDDDAPPEASSVAGDAFGDLLDALQTSGDELDAKFGITSYVGMFGARVTVDGRRQLVESTVPLRARGEDGRLAPVDLGVQEQAGGDLEPVNPPVPVVLPQNLADGITVGAGAGKLVMTPVGASGASPAETVNDATVLWASSLTDTDILASAANAGGVETFAQLRSESAPEELRWHVSAADGEVSLLATVAGGVRVFVDGVQVGAFQAPWATDAQQRPVRVRMWADGSDVVMNVSHRGEEVAYPILADPLYEDHYYSGSRWDQGNTAGLSDWAYAENPAGWYPHGTSCIGGANCVGTGHGLYVYTYAGLGYSGSAGHYAEYFFAVPGGLGRSTYIPRVDYIDHFVSWYGAGANVYAINGIWDASVNNWTGYQLVANGQSSLQTTYAGQNMGSYNTAGGKQAVWGAIPVGTSHPYATALSLGGVLVMMDDPEAPALATVSVTPAAGHGPAPTGWIRDWAGRLSFQGSDPGVGVKAFSVFTQTTTLDGGSWSDQWDSWQPATTNAGAQCTGLAALPCFTSASGWFDLSSWDLPEGTTTFGVCAYDALGKSSACQTPLTLKIERGAPTAGISGLAEGAKFGDGPFAVTAVTTDELSGPMVLAIAVDGKVVSKATKNAGQVSYTCAADAASKTAWGAGSVCSTVNPNNMSNTWTLRGEDLAEGMHTITVGAVDKAHNYTPSDAIASKTIYVHHSQSSQVGPGSVNLRTGNLEVTASDVSIPAYTGALTVQRTFNSRGVNSAATGPFGPGWTTSMPGEGEWAFSTVRSSTDYQSVWVMTDDGEELAFAKNGLGYDSPPEAPDLKLSGDGVSTFTLTDLDGNTTVFGEKAQVSTPTEAVVFQYKPTSSAGPLSATATSFRYDASKRLVEVVGPVAPGVGCTVSSRTAGCRTLTVGWASSTTATSSTPGDYAGRIKELKLNAYDAAGNANAVTVAQYAYDAAGRLVAAWDPRISPALKTTYAYDAASNLTGVTPPGQQPWTITYATITGDSDPGRVATISRTDSDLGQTATWRMRYGVPVSGTGAPFAMGAGDVAAWGQTDTPAFATAVVPPDGSISSYGKNEIHYLDQVGREVNLADRAGAITTTEYEDAGGASFENVTRTLTAANRVRALAAGTASATRAAELDTRMQYNSDHTVVVDQLEPLHSVRLDNSSTVQARKHTVTTYDEGAPASGGPYRLPTTTRVSARLTDGTDTNTRTTTTGYTTTSGASGWTIRKPVTQTVVVGGVSNTRRWVYDVTTGQTLQTRLPGGPNGGTAHTTLSSYYNPYSSDPACTNKLWVGWPCKTQPAAQPSSAGMPAIPTTTTAAYNTWGQPTSVITSGTASRTTTLTYDGAGRQLTESTTTPSGMTAVLAQTTGYSSTQGAPISLSTSGDGKQISWTLDGWGRVRQYTDATGNIATTTYDLLGRTATHSDGKGTQTYTYDPATGRATKISDSAAGDFTANAQTGYDADGQLVSQTYPSGLVKALTYDETGSPTLVTYTKPGGGTLFSDLVNESVFGQQRAESMTGVQRSYNYDALGRLTRVDDIPSGQGCTVRSYGYDADSNRTSLTVRPPGTGGACQTTTGTTTNHTYDEADRLIDTGYTYDAFGNTLTVPAADANGPALTATYFADDRVRRLTQGTITQTITNDPARRTLEMATTGGATITHRYDQDSDNPAWTAENATGTAWTRNISDLTGDLAATQTQAGTITYQLASLHGDTVATTLNSTTLATNAVSDEFGVPLTTTPARYAYLGAKQRATALPSGAILMGQRVYTPSIGRFLQVDPVRGGSFNDYDYAYQDPLNQFDLDGRCPVCRVLPSLGRAVKGAGNFVGRQASSGYRFVRSVRVKVAYHSGHPGGPHQHPHVQINVWRKSVPRSGRVLRIPERPIHIPRNKR